jgi:hypothetical protein
MPTTRPPSLPAASPRAERATSRWGQDRRLEFIDWRLRWDGRLNRSDLTAFFEISVPQASLDIAKYLELAPRNAGYDRSAKVYLALDSFEPLFGSTSPQRFLNELIAQATGILPTELSFLGWAPTVDVAPSPGRVVSVDVLLPLLQAIRKSEQLAVQYQSMSSLEPTARTLSPHALGFDGFRWHARAFCHERLEFRDFVVARMLNASLAEAPGTDAAQDHAWHQLVTLELGPNPELPAAAKVVIELDYGMTDGRVALRCRQALLFYALKRLGLLRDQEAPAHVQQIALLNRAEVERFLPATGGPDGGGGRKRGENAKPGVAKAGA